MSSKRWEGITSSNSKATRVASWIAPKACWHSRIFPPETDSGFEKHHDRLERRRIARISLSPEEAGLVGCWQFVAVLRERQCFDGKTKESCEIAYYATILTQEEIGAEELSALTRDHWSAIENGVHYRRDVSFQEDKCQVRNRVGPEVLATLRNLAIALYELEIDRKSTKASSLRCWMKAQTFSNAHRLLRR